MNSIGLIVQTLYRQQDYFSDQNFPNYTPLQFQTEWNNIRQIRKLHIQQG